MLQSTKEKESLSINKKRTTQGNEGRIIRNTKDFQFIRAANQDEASMSGNYVKSVN